MTNNRPLRLSNDSRVEILTGRQGLIHQNRVCCRHAIGRLLVKIGLALNVLPLRRDDVLDTQHTQTKKPNKSHSHRPAYQRNAKD